MILWILALPWVLAANQCSLAPAFFSGQVVENCCQGEWKHNLSWGPSADSQVVGYRIYQNKTLVSETTDQEPNEVTLQNRIAGRNYTYKLVSFTANGSESCPLIITLGPCKKEAYTNCCKHKRITFTATTTNPTAGGSNGSITINASGGTPPYQYSLDQGAFQSSNVFQGLSAGTHTIVIKDCKNTLLYGTVTLAGGSTISFTTSLSNPCERDSNGSITINASGGKPPYSYSIGGAFQSSNIFYFLPAGTYTLVVKDSRNATVSGQATLMGGASMLYDLQTISPTQAGSCADGEIIFSDVEYGKGTIAYSIDGGQTFSLASSFTGLGSGSYPLMIIDQVNAFTTTATPSTAGIMLNAGTSSRCGTTPSYPGAGTGYYTDIAVPSLTSDISQCVSVQFTYSCTGNVLVAAYGNSFDPANPQTNFLGFSGTTASGTLFSIKLPPSTELHLVLMSTSSSCSVTVTALTASPTSCSVTGNASLSCPPPQP